MFLHRNIHKYSWTPPNGKTHNQIDHVLVNRRWHSSILDVRSFMGHFKVECSAAFQQMIMQCQLSLHNHFQGSWLW